VRFVTSPACGSRCWAGGWPLPSPDLHRQELIRFLGAPCYSWSRFCHCEEQRVSDPSDAAISLLTRDLSVLDLGLFFFATDAHRWTQIILCRGGSRTARKPETRHFTAENTENGKKTRDQEPNISPPGTSVLIHPCPFVIADFTFFPLKPQASCSFLIFKPPDVKYL